MAGDAAMNADSTRFTGAPFDEVGANGRGEGSAENIAHIVVEDHGPAAKHNMPCAVCRTQKAVLELDSGVFHPCWVCQGSGWRIERPTFFDRLWMFFVIGLIWTGLWTLFVAIAKWVGK
jgi:hypothetical protein